MIAKIIRGAWFLCQLGIIVVVSFNVEGVAVAGELPSLVEARVNENRAQAVDMSFTEPSLARSAKEDELPPVKDEILDGLKSSFSMPFDDWKIKKDPSEFVNLLDGLSLRVAYDMPLNPTPPLPSMGKGAQGARGSGSPTMQLGIKYTPLSSWFVSATFVKYMHSSWQAPWNPDFSYVFGYDDWHPYTLSLTYSNFGGNRLNPSSLKQENMTRFREGTWSLGWKFPVPKKIEQIFTLNERDTIGCNLSFNWSPQYLDAVAHLTKANKITQSMACKYSIYEWWYFNFTINHYPDITQRQAWSPDYTYGFGYADWHPGTLSIQYNNYSGNRFPWGMPAQGTGKFKNGSITFSTSWSW